MPTAAATTFTNLKLEAAFHDELLVHFSGKLTASTTYPLGCLLGELTATPGTYSPFVSGNADGSQLVKAILPYACITDASGNITIGTAVGGGEFAQTYPSIDLYIGGYFMSADLPQAGTGAINAAAVDGTHGNLILKQGTTALGIVRLP